MTPIPPDGHVPNCQASGHKHNGALHRIRTLEWPHDMAISDELKKVIRDSGLTVSETSRRAGVPRPSLSRFLNEGHDSRGLSLETVDKLATFFGLRLIHDGSTIQPDPPKQTIASRIRELLLETPVGLTSRQVANQIIGTNGASYSTIKSTLGGMKRSRKVRRAKSGVYTLVKKSAKR